MLPSDLNLPSGLKGGVFAACAKATTELKTVGTR